MATPKNDLKQKGYTLAEIKDKYFPNRDLSSLTNRDDDNLTQEAYLNILRKISRPPKKQPAKEQR